MGKYKAFNVKLSIIQRLPRFSLCTYEIGVSEIQKFKVTRFCYKWFGLHFTGAWLPSLARRACLPTDSATLQDPLGGL